MRERFRVVLAACFYYSGLVMLVNWWMQRFRRRLIILNYHSAASGNLRRQMLYLRRHYRILHLEQALEEFYGSDPQTRSSDRRLPLVLTFDDGYYDNYTQGLQLARTLRVPITIFLLPGYIESGRYFWWLAGKYLLEHTTVEKITIEDHTYHLSQPGERGELLKVIDRHLRMASSVAEREAFLENVQHELGVSLPVRTTTLANDGFLPLTWEEVREMEQSGWVSFGAHTQHHPVLGHLTSAAEVQYEVTECRCVLEQALGHPVRTFAYPIGKFEHFGEMGLQAVKNAGYDWALTTIEETNSHSTDRYLLRRLPGDLDQHWLVMASELAGLLGILSRLRKKR